MTGLTRSQKDVLAELRRGGTVEQIARRMWLSASTVKTHLHGREELLEAIEGEV